METQQSNETQVSPATMAAKVASEKVEKKKKEDARKGDVADPAHYERLKKAEEARQLKDLNAVASEHYEVVHGKECKKVLKISTKRNGNVYSKFAFTYNEAGIVEVENMIQKGIKVVGAIDKIKKKR